MVGKAHIENQKAIEHYGQVRVLGRLPFLPQLGRKALLKAFNSHFDRTAFEG